MSITALPDLDTQIRQVLQAHARLSRPVRDITDDDDLYECGMTSHASVNVMLALESACGIEFPDRMLRRGVFCSIASIREALAELTARV